VLAFQKIEVVPEFAQHRLRLMLDFFEQNFLRAHAGKISRFPMRGKACLPSRNNRSTRLLPMKPAAPVTKILSMIERRV
jgi:hypothetical protein